MDIEYVIHSTDLKFPIMTSVGKVVKRLDKIQEELQKLSLKSMEASISELNHLNQLLFQLQELRETLHGMESKFDQKDPVSGGRIGFVIVICHLYVI